MRTVSATIDIGAPPMEVSAILTDLGRYHEWNPLFAGATGNIAVGQRITLRSWHPANGRLMTVKPKITAARPGTELRWISSLPGIISGEHAFTLTPAGSGTRVVQSETFRGPARQVPSQDLHQRRDQFPGPQRGSQGTRRSPRGPASRIAGLTPLAANARGHPLSAGLVSGYYTEYYARYNAGNDDVVSVPHALLAAQAGRVRVCPGCPGRGAATAQDRGPAVSRR